jgi:hypothetical protein
MHYTRIYMTLALFVGCDISKDNPSANGDWSGDGAGTEWSEEDTADADAGDGDDSSGDETGSDETGGDETGSDETGSDETGGDESGGDETGGDETGSDETGGDETGSDETGGDETGGDETGGDETGGDETGGDETGGDETGGDETGGDDAGDAPYALWVTPDEIDFGAVTASTTSAQMVDIKNVGTESIHINGIGVSDSTIFDFLPDFAVPITLPPGMERSMRVDFTPLDATTYAGEITFVTEEVLAESADILLQGVGEGAPCEICAPVIDVHPGELSLDALLTCEVSDSVTVTNNGDRNLRITSVNIINGWPSCGNFTRAFEGPVTLEPFESTAIMVTFRATSECADLYTLGSDDNTMHIMSNDPSDPDYTVGLSGFATCLLGK